MKLMFSSRNNSNGNPFDRDLEDEIPSSCPSAKGERKGQFIRIPIVIVCTVTVFVLLITGTAFTSISFPPRPAKNQQPEKEDSLVTVLDGDYKLIGPLLITAGGFLLVVDVVLCAIITKDAYVASRSIKPATPIEAMRGSGAMSVLGGPFYLATPNPTLANPNAMIPFAFSRSLWAIPNAPAPDLFLEDEVSKGSKIRAATATLVRSSQPPYNPDVKPSTDIS